MAGDARPIGELTAALADLAQKVAEAFENIRTLHANIDSLYQGQQRIQEDIETLFADATPKQATALNMGRPGS